MRYYFAFDLDGTITKQEILPLLSSELGIYSKMALLTKKTMDGEIPFDQSFEKRVNMLKKIPLSRVKNIISKVELNEDIVRFIRQNKDRCYVVTQNLDIWIEDLVKKIGVPFLSSKAKYEGDTLLGIDTILRKKSIHSQIDFPVIPIGDGFNDLEMMIDAPLSIAFGGIHKPAPALLEVADYVIYDGKHLCRFLKQLL